MPKNLDATIRYRVIDRCLRSKSHKYPSKEYLCEKCAEAVGASVIATRTIEKDLNEMRHNESLAYFAPIKYDAYHKGYFYEDENYSIDRLPLGEEDMMAIDLAAQVLEQYKHIDIFSGFKPVVEKLAESLKLRQKTKDTPEMMNYIHFEHKAYVQGGIYLQDVLHAIQNNFQVSIQYLKFNQAEGKTYLLNPYVLKEYQGLWYVLGMLSDSQEIRTFALDRIKKMEVLSSVFVRDLSFDYRAYFNEVIGITHQNHATPVEVKLVCAASLTPYLQLLPLHFSQQFENATHLTVHLIPNHEFFMKVLSYGEDLQVIEPKFVKDKIGSTLKAMIKKY
jgi:predicted DNA-binding transcriptional regulator YafY